MMNGGSRFAGLSHTKAIALVLALLVLLIAAIALKQGAAPTIKSGAVSSVQTASTADDDDLVLYRSIYQRVAAGENYYEVASDEQRRGDYPVRPFITVRLPTLATLFAVVGPSGMKALNWMLMIATLLAWRTQLKREMTDSDRHLITLLLIVIGLTIAVKPVYLPVHEIWAGTLIALSLGLHRKERWWPSVLVALAAVMIRELALPYILLMGAFALFERRWKEFLAWAACVALFGIVMLFHARAVEAVTLATDPASQGWTRFGGWPTFVRTMTETSALRVFPTWAATGLLILTLFGWTSWRSYVGLFGTLFFAGYGIFFMLLGRPENFYWGLTVTPLFLIGLAFLPTAFVDLKASILGPDRQLDSAAL